MTHILFHRHTPWQSEIRCSTNIFAALFMKDGFDVSYMQGIVHAGNIMAHRGQWKSWKQGPRWDKGAWVFTPASIIPFSKIWPFNTPLAAHMSFRTCYPGIKKQVCAAGKGEPDIIWSANPASISLKSIFPKAKFVFQVVDYYPAFSGNSIRKIEKSDYAKADHLFVIGETLKTYMVNDLCVDPEKITVLGQGVFTENYQKDFSIPEDIKNLPRPLAVWVGVLKKGDPRLFDAAAKVIKKRGGSMVLIGPGAQWAEQLSEQYKNVSLLGPRSPDLVPAYLRHADMGLMLYDQNRQDIYKGQNPLKLYEYAAAGLPIISTDHDEYAYLYAPVTVVKHVDEVENAINDAFDRSAEFKDKATAFVKTRSWQSVYERARLEIEKMLSEELQPAPAVYP